MSKETTKAQKFSKEAFLNAAASSKERLILQVVLKNGDSYTKAEAEKLVNDWKNKKVVNDVKKKEVK
ncbi:hypothetical protein [Cytobacillus firmus]|uniref:hypothetical protein n=1 Tax=Cytobacillus firmus TaxID=1399 RepID=UPI0018CEBDAC|nr:hypothetical protein [Cytobacillus firmus]MBG9548347.1 hypothetical protein [Cytobacillus firmus]MBG9600803.1 hypothetical protein [Cytobacillus firmus]MED1938941.1 hypothetical protein [Cytobacillus firmus]